MRHRRNLLACAAVLITALASCAPATPARDAPGPSPESPRSGPIKRIVAAVPAELPGVHGDLNPGAGGQARAVQELVVAGLTIAEPLGTLQPQLAEAVPSIENGLWKVLPDGRMETTWRIREGALWHDGTPFTAQDLLFTGIVVREGEVPEFSNVNYRNIEAVEAPDARTIAVRWKTPFIGADAMFGQRLAPPLPKHLLEAAYASKSGFVEQPYFGEAFVGTGPFKLAELVRTSHMLFTAFDRFVLGRPKVDQVEVRFILDESAIVANLMAGSVDLTLARSLGPEHGWTLDSQWREGRVGWDQVGSWFVIYPQYVDPNPPVILDVRFRRALLHATDRVELAGSLIGDASGVPHGIVHPQEPEYADVERGIVRYEYDPRRAAQLLDGLGYARRDAGFYQDAAGERLQFELRAVPNDAHIKILATLADAWGRQGIGVDQLVIPRQRSLDAEFRATFPALEAIGHPVEVERFYGREARLPERGYTGGNNSRYMSPELDALIDRYFTTIPKVERNRALADIVHYISDQVVVLGLAWRADPTAIASRLVNVGVKGPKATQAWNSKDWDVR